MKLSERMEEVQGPASYWITDVEKLEAENERLQKKLQEIKDYMLGFQPFKGWAEEDALKSGESDVAG